VSIRVLIVDDEELVRFGLRTILDSSDDVEVVGEAGDGVQACGAAPTLHPDVVLMDIRMPRMDGLEATRRILSGPDPPAVAILTTFHLDENVFPALEAGASLGALQPRAGAVIARVEVGCRVRPHLRRRRRVHDRCDVDARSRCGSRSTTWAPSTHD
jgi:DNA-binding NarL/FixJ family response regulator